MTTLKGNKLMTAVILGVVVLGSAFYWYEYRPNQIIKKCSPELSRTELTNDGSIFGKQTLTDKYYIACLKRNGLKD